MSLRKRLGQHILLDKIYVELIASSAAATMPSSILEIGTGTGILTEFLCRKCDRVVSYEKDRKLLEAARLRLKKHKNVILVLGDGFQTKEDCDTFVSNLPYSQSRKFILWASEKKFKSAVVTVQHEFAEKIFAKAGEGNYRAVSVIGRASFHVSIIGTIPRNAFDPAPRVDSSILLFSRKRILSTESIRSIIKLFSYKGKTVASALKHLNLNLNFPNQILLSRIGRLDVDDMYEIAERIAEFNSTRSK